MDKVAKEAVLARSLGFPCCSRWSSQSFLSFKWGAPLSYFNLSTKHKFPQNQSLEASCTLRSEEFVTEAWENRVVRSWQMVLISVWGMKVFAVRLKRLFFLEGDKKFKYNKNMHKFNDFEVNIFQNWATMSATKVWHEWDVNQCLWPQPSPHYNYSGVSLPLETTGVIFRGLWLNHKIESLEAENWHKAMKLETTLFIEQNHFSFFKIIESFFSLFHAHNENKSALYIQIFYECIEFQ